jgi:hypothetical protein
MNNSPLDTSISTNTINYQWQVSVDNATTFTNLSSAPNGSSLTISNVLAEQHNHYYRVIATSGSSSVISKPARLIAIPELNITSQPIDQVVDADNGNSAIFSVAVDASNGAQVLYQWEIARSSSPSSFEAIPGANQTNLLLNDIDAADDNTAYRVRITAYFYDKLPVVAYSNTANLDFIGPPINITNHPSDYVLTDLATTSPLFSVSAVSLVSSEPLSYQWQESLDGTTFVNLPFTDSANLFINNIENPEDKNQFQYRVIVSSDSGSITSQAATLINEIDLPLTDKLYNSTSIWGDPHMNIASSRGALASLDDNQASGPIVLFYLKYENGESYKVVCDSKFGAGASSGPTALTDIWVEKNGIRYTGTPNSFDKSTAVPSTSLTLSSCTYAGVTGWNYFSGRCLSFSTTAGAKNLTNTNYVQLLKNSVKWLYKNQSNPSIIIFSSGKTTQDNALKNAIASTTNKTISIIDMNTFTNSNNILASTNVVILQNNYNWSSATIPAAGQQALKDFVTKGGGLLTSEWVIWNIAVGKMSLLSDVVPVYPTSRYTNKSPIRYIQNMADSVLNTGVSTDFQFLSENIAGTETSIVSAKPGSTIFYHSEQCLPQLASQQTVNIGNMLDIIYKPGSGTWANRVWYLLYIRWNSTLSYKGKAKIGGALYWILKSLIEHKKTPKDAKYAGWKGTIRGSKIAGYDLVMKPYGISRTMLSNAVNAADGSSAINAITEEISLSDRFWKNMSKLLRGLTPNDKYFVRNVLYFAKHPGNRLTTTNVAVSMDATAYSTSKNTIIYRWQVSANNGLSYSNIADGTEYGGTGTNTLVIKKPSLLYHNRYYRLSISSSGAITKYSQPSVLTVLPTIAVSSFPTQQQSIGGKATYSIRASSSDGSLSYQWQVSSNNRTYSNIAKANSADLVVGVVSYSQNNTYYRVVLKNRNETFVSNGVKLIAVPSIDITSQPIDKTVSSNSVIFSVTANHNNVLSSSTPLTYQWQYSSNNRTWYNIANAKQSVLSINNLTRSNNNYYYRVVMSVGTFSAISRAAKLTILPTISYAPISINMTNKTVSGVEYIDLTFQINASTTTGTLTYQWQQSSNRGYSYSNIVGATSSAVGIRNLRKSSYSLYRYRVVVKNGVDTITVPVNLI